METVTSADGTPIAYERSGGGPALVVSTGALRGGPGCPAGRDRMPHPGPRRRAERALAFEGATAIAAAVPDGRAEIVEAQHHGVDPAVAAAVLVEFCGA